MTRVTTRRARAYKKIHLRNKSVFWSKTRSLWTQIAMKASGDDGGLAGEFLGWKIIQFIKKAVGTYLCFVYEQLASIVANTRSLNNFRVTLKTDKQLNEFDERPIWHLLSMRWNDTFSTIHFTSRIDHSMFEFRLGNWISWYSYIYIYRFECASFLEIFRLLEIFNLIFVRC